MNRCPELNGKSVPAFARNWALFLDVDGTLLDFAQYPGGVAVSQELRHVLEAIHRLSGDAIALISGRKLSDLDRLFGPMRFPAAGQHGLERRDWTGRVTQSTAALNQISCAARELEDQARLHPGILVEHKGLSLALHYRGAPQAREWAELTMRGLLAKLGADFNLVVGKMVYELKPGGRNKGTAIADFMREAPFAGRLPVFIGDDMTDEDGFKAVNSAGGHSIKVGQGPSLAHFHLCDAQSVRCWLESYTAFLNTPK